MITYVELTDFQSWRSLQMELGQVTMLVGRGNSGKTAIARAIEYALTNQSGDSFIREGAPRCQVGLAFVGTDGEEHALLWTKERGKGAEYLLDGMSFTKTGATVPAEVAALTGIREISIDKTTSILPQLQGQFDPPFILGESGSKIARIIGKLTKLNVLVTAQLACKNDASIATQEAKRWRVQAADVEERLSRIPDTAALWTEGNELNDREEALQTRHEDLARAERALYTLRRAEAIAAAGDAATLGEAVGSCMDSLQQLTFDEVAVVAYRAACSDLADAGLASDRATEELDDAQRAYEKLVTECGLCEECPYQ